MSFNDLLEVVGDVSLHYYSHIRGLSSGTTTLDFNSAFGRSIDAFYGRKDHIIEALWNSKLHDSSENIRAIREWLSVRDDTIRTIIRNRTEAAGHRDEYTCEWFSRHLLDFSRGNDNFLAVRGPSGCGKSVLAGWIVERLQRPLGRKTHETLSLVIGRVLQVFLRGDFFLLLYRALTKNSSRYGNPQ